MEGLSDQLLSDNLIRLILAPNTEICRQQRGSLPTMLRTFPEWYLVTTRLLHPSAAKQYLEKYTPKCFALGFKCSEESSQQMLIAHPRGSHRYAISASQKHVETCEQSKTHGQSGI